MRLTAIVRTGGRLALAIGFIGSNLVFSNSLALYYGYAPSNFGVSQASDPFSTQNVAFTPQVSLFTSQSQSLLYTPASSAVNTSAVATSYGYSAPAAQTTLFSTSPATNMYATNTYAAPAYTPLSPALSDPAYSTPQNAATQLSGFSLASAVPTSAGMAYASPMYISTPALDSSVTGISLYAAVRVSSVLSGPVASKTGTTVNLQPATVTLNGDVAPEPSTWMGMSAGLAFLLFKLRRR